MARTSTKGRPGGEPVRRRPGVAAAGRAADKRAQRAGRSRTEPPPAPGEPAAAGPEPQDTAPRRRPQLRGLPRLPRFHRLRRRPQLLRALLVVATAAAVAATALLGVQYRSAQQTDRARDEATATARKVAPKILSYDYRHLKKDFASARGHLTGHFRDQFEKTTESVVTPTAKKYHGVVKATVAHPPGGGEPAVSAVSAAPDKVVVLLFMNQVTKSTKLSEPRLDLNRVRMTLVDTSSGWKVSALDAL